jgi:hypothetical protein
MLLTRWRYHRGGTMMDNVQNSCLFCDSVPWLNRL